MAKYKVQNVSGKVRLILKGGIKYKGGAKVFNGDIVDVAADLVKKLVKVGTLVEVKEEKEKQKGGK